VKRTWNPRQGQIGSAFFLGAMRALPMENSYHGARSHLLNYRKELRSRSGTGYALLSTTVSAWISTAESLNRSESGSSAIVALTVPAA
jgi:hypothetical protein